MTNFIKNPNLPMGKVTSVICGELCPELNSFLESRGIKRFVIESNSHIDHAVRFHADMATVHLGGNKIIVDKNQIDLIKDLEHEGFTVIETKGEIKGEYPCDISLNFTVIKDRIIGNFRFADEALTDNISYFKRINVKQGYCKCSCLVISDSALITDDKSIYDNALRNSLDCLLVSKGDVTLDGHEYGFIGGASAKISATEVLFFGDITKHTDYKKIAAFIKKHGCKIISLDFELTDFGGIISITEKAP